MKNQLAYAEDVATLQFHIFTMSVYFLSIVGAILCDGWWGKFKTIFRFSVLYVLGCLVLSVTVIPKISLFFGLTLIAMGRGGIKPCVSPFGGDQFKLPEQVAQLETFFSIFYFITNVGSLISTALTPILREDVQCFDNEDCYPLAFGVSAIAMLIGLGKFHFCTSQSNYIL